MTQPRVGELAKVRLPGERLWVECVALHPDGTWEGRIDNRPVSGLHDFKQNDVVRFAWAGEMWEPTEREAGSA